MKRADKEAKKAEKSIVLNDKESVNVSQASDVSLPEGWDYGKVVEALIREKELKLNQAQMVADSVEEELSGLGTHKVEEAWLADLVETKLIELGIKEVDEDDRASEEPSKYDGGFFAKGRVPFSPNAIRVLERRYLKKDFDGNPIERPEEMLRRVARVVAGSETIYDPNADLDAIEEEFYQLMAELKFIPNSPTLMNAGRDLGQLSACFVLPVEDSMESIFESLKNAALIHQSGGGTGFSFSKIRPRNDVVNSTQGVSSGPVSFMNVYNSATETIKQGGTRRGANMGILRVDHPDILGFISCKEDGESITNFNISVGLTGNFMKAVESDEKYDLVNPRTGEVTGRLRAKDVFDRIVKAAHSNGEPGIVFLDRLNRDNPTPKLGEIESTNPCGEQPLLPYESCNLGSINLAKAIKDGEIDWDELRRTVWCSVHFLDNVIDANRYPLGPEGPIARMTKTNRKIGLGVMGFADILIELGIPYDSPEALDMGEKVMDFVQREGKLASAALAKKRGPFPAFDDSIFAEAGEPALRNATVTTLAPTGTISIIAGSSSGIEPIFAICYIRNVMNNDELVEVNPIFERMAREQGFYSEALMRKIAEQGHLEGIEEVPEDIAKLFTTAHEVSPETHIRMQAAFQKYTDNAVSKTVNFPEDAAAEDVAKVYMQAWALGCKGVTVYRDKSRDSQVLNIGKVNREDGAVAQTPSEQVPTSKVPSPPSLSPRKRPDVIIGATRRLKTGCGNLYVTINEDEEGMFEIFTAMGKAGGCASSQAEAVSRLISLSLRAGVDTEAILRQLRGISCPSPAWQDGEMIMSCADGLAKAIELYLAETRVNGERVMQKVEARVEREKKRPVYHTPVPVEGPMPTICPDCSSRLEYGGGCAYCRGCGFQKCS